MKVLKIGGVLVALGGASALALVLAGTGYLSFGSPVLAQGRPGELERSARSLMTLAGRGAEIGVRVGESPTTGVVIEEVQPDSPAEKAGLRRGDVIVRFGERPVTTIYDYMYGLQDHKPGDTVAVVVKRTENGKTSEVTLQLTLGTRPSGMR